MRETTYGNQQRETLLMSYKHSNIELLNKEKELVNEVNTIHNTEVLNKEKQHVNEVKITIRRS